MGAPVGNNNAANGKEWRNAIRRALAHKHGSVQDGLLAIARQLVDKAEDGDIAALREIGDREDGKPQQSIDAQVTGSLTGILESLPLVTGPDKTLDR
jgi:hypothetical protein